MVVSESHDLTAVRGRFHKMDNEDDAGGLFAIEVSSEDETSQPERKLPRDFQSEEEFQHIKATYKPKIETGEVILPSPHSNSLVQCSNQSSTYPSWCEILISCQRNMQTNDIRWWIL